MKRIIPFIATSSAGLLILCQAHAQSNGGPLREYVDNNGVNLLDGSLKYTIGPISIGPVDPLPGETQSGLSFYRTYRNQYFFDNIGGNVKHSTTSLASYTVNFEDTTSNFSSSTAITSPTQNPGTFQDNNFKGGILSYNPTTRIYTYYNSIGVMATYDGNYPPAGNPGTIPQIGGILTSVTEPSGRTIKYSYDITTYVDKSGNTQPAYRVKSIVSSDGYSMKITYQSNSAITGGDPSTWQWITEIDLHDDSSGADGEFLKVSPFSLSSETYTNSAGEQTTINTSYNSVTLQRSALTSIREPGYSSDNITITPSASQGGQWTLAKDGISTIYTSQQTPGHAGLRTVTETLNGVNIATVTSYISDGFLTSYTDGLGRVTTMDIAPGSGSVENVLTETLPSGASIIYSVDPRYNILSETRKASGLTDIVKSWQFPATCTNPKTCNKPTSATDANSNTTTYVYDPQHGGITSETMPVVNGISPQKRNFYQQKYAYIKNADGTFSQGTAPMWVLTSTSECKTGQPSGSGCSTSGDEIKTNYEYGSSPGPNTLFLYGVVSDYGGINERLCYKYDSTGNKISETKPRANLSSCS